MDDCIGRDLVICEVSDNLFEMVGKAGTYGYCDVGVW
jgi:hypothetical protein